MAAIEVNGLHKRYGDTVAVEDVGLRIEQGEIFGLLGRNGAGKTTLVECIMGLRVPDRGEVRVLGLDPWRDRHRLRQVLGAQLQESRLPDRLRVGEAVRLYRSFYARGADPERLLTELGLGDQRDTAFEDLSGGQQQRLSVALALVGHPRVAVLDELTTGLDPQSRRDLWTRIEQIRDAGVTVVLVTHFMDEAQRLCDRVAVVEAGRIVALDTPTGLIAATSGGQRLHVRTAVPFDLTILRAIPGVGEVVRRDGEVVVHGEGELLLPVVTRLVEAGVTVIETRAGDASLEDAFLRLTARPLAATSHGGHRLQGEVVR